MIKAGYDADCINGSMLPLTLLSISIISITIAGALKLVFRKIKLCTKLFNLVYKQLCYNFYITLLMETALAVGFTAAIRVMYFMNDNTWW